MASNNRNSQQRRLSQDANDRSRNPAPGHRAQQPPVGSLYAKRRVDTRKVQETLLEMFANVFHAEVIRSVGQACSWKLNKCIEALIMLSEDNDPQPVSMPPHLGNSVISPRLPAANEIGTGNRPATPNKITQNSYRQHSSSSDTNTPARESYSNSSGRSKSVMMNAGQGPIKVTYKSYNNCNAEADDDDDADVVVEEEKEVDLSNHDMSFVGAATQSVCQFVNPSVSHNIQKMNGLSLSPGTPAPPPSSSPSPSPRRMPVTTQGLTMPVTPMLPESSSSSARKSKHFSKLDRIKKLVFSGVKVMILMRGCPGSGKSTLARHIVKVTWGSERIKRYIFSTDDYFAMSGKYVFVPKLLPQAHSWNQQRVVEAARAGMNPIIVDNTNIQDWEMQPYAVMAVKFGYILELVEPRTSWRNNPFELARKTVHRVPRPTIEKMLMRFDHELTGRSLLEVLLLQYSPNMKPPQRAANRPPHPPGAVNPTGDKKKTKCGKDAAKQEKRTKPVQKKPHQKSAPPIQMKSLNNHKHPDTHSQAMSKEQMARQTSNAAESTTNVLEDPHSRVESVNGNSSGLSSTESDGEESLVSTSDEEEGEWENESLGDLEYEDCIQLLEVSKEEQKDTAQAEARVEAEENCKEYALVLEDGTLLTRKAHRKEYDSKCFTGFETGRIWEYLLMTDDSGLLLQGNPGSDKGKVVAANQSKDARHGPYIQHTEIHGNKLDICQELASRSQASASHQSYTTPSDESFRDTPNQPSFISSLDTAHAGSKGDGGAGKTATGPCVAESELSHPSRIPENKSMDVGQTAAMDGRRSIGVGSIQQQRSSPEPQKPVEFQMECLYQPTGKLIDQDLTSNEDSYVAPSEAGGSTKRDEAKEGIVSKLIDFSDDEMPVHSNKKSHKDVVPKNINAVDGRSVSSDTLDLLYDNPAPNELSSKGQVFEDCPASQIAIRLHDFYMKNVASEAGINKVTFKSDSKEAGHVQSSLEQGSTRVPKENVILCKDLDDLDQVNGNVQCNFAALHKWEMSKVSWDEEDAEQKHGNSSAPKPARSNRRLSPTTPQRILTSSCGVARPDPVGDTWTASSMSAAETWEQHNESCTDKPKGNTTSPQPQRRAFAQTTNEGSKGGEQSSANESTFDAPDVTREECDCDKQHQSVTPREHKLQTPTDFKESLDKAVGSTEPLNESPVEKQKGGIERERTTSETNTHHLDFILLSNINSGEGTSASGVMVKHAISRNIISSEDQVPLERKRKTHQIGMFDKSSMTSDAMGAHTEGGNIGEQLEELVRMFPHCSVDDLKEIHERCNMDINWTVDLLLESQSQGIELSTAKGLPPQPERERERRQSSEEAPAVPAAEPAKLAALPKRNGRRDRGTVSEESLLLKRMVEETIVINDQHYSDHVSRIRKLRHGELADVSLLDGSAPLDPGVAFGAEQDAEARLATTAQALRPDAPEWGAAEPDLSEPWLEEEETTTVALTLDGSVADQLHDMFGTASLPFKEETKPTVTLPLSLARQLHYYLMEAQQNTYELMMQEDEELARGLQEQEQQESERLAAAEPEAEAEAEQVPDLREIMDMEMALAFYKADQKQCGGEERDNLATKLTKNLLCDWFPSLPRDVLMNVFEAHNHSFDQTLEVLLASTGGDQSVRTVMSPEARAAQERALIERASQESQKRSEYWRSSQADDQDELSPEQALEEANHQREEARHHYTLRSECQQKAQRAYQKGLTAVAAYYSQMASLHKRRIEDSNARAASSLLLAHSLGNLSSTLDLHFLYVSEALQVLDVFLDHHLRQLASTGRRCTHVFIITGRGARSSGGRSRIKPAVEQRLEQRSLRYAEMNPGLLKVIISKNSALSSSLLSGGH